MYLEAASPFFDGDAYVSSETPLGDNSVRVQSPKRVSFPIRRVGLSEDSTAQQCLGEAT